MSENQLQMIKDNFSLGKSKTLIPNLGNKRKCKLHYQRLKRSLSLGLQLKKKSHNIKIQTRTIFKTIY